MVALRRRRNLEFALTTEEDAYTQKHSKRKADAVKSLHMAYANLLAGLLEDLPLGFIGLRFIQLSAQHPKLFEPISYVLLLSVLSSGFSAYLHAMHVHAHVHTSLRAHMLTISMQCWASSWQNCPC